MQNTKLVKLLRTFSTREVKDFEKFILSPYFLRGRNLLPLWKVLKKFYPSFDSPQLTKEKVFKKVHPGKKFDRKSGHALTVAISEMSLLAEKFLAFELIQKRNDGYKLYDALSEALFEKDLISLTLKVLEKNSGRIQKIPELLNYYHEMTNLNINFTNCYAFKTRQKKLLLYSQKTAPYFYGYMFLVYDRLLRYHFAAWSKFAVDLKYSKLIEMGFNSFDPKTFENYCFDDGKGTKQFVLMLYYLVKSRSDDEDEGSLMAVIKYYKNNFRKLNWSTKFSLMLNILDICSKRLLLSDIYRRLANEMVDIAVDNEIFSDSEGMVMQTGTYHLYFQIKMYYKNGSEVKKFVEKVINRVDPEYKEFMYNYSFALVNFFNMDYEKTLEYISKLNTSELTIKILINRLNIFSLYSLGYIEEAIYSLDSFERNYSKSSKISQRYTYIKSIKDFIDSMRTLIKFRTNSKSADQLALNEILIKNQNPFYYFWFKAEVEKLKKENHL